jgi:hypothetical protein
MADPWNTPAGGPSPFDDLEIPDNLDELVAEVIKKVDKELETDPVYQSFKQGAERSRRFFAGTTFHWNSWWR